jgi:hypothetical protein
MSPEDKAQLRKLVLMKIDELATNGKAEHVKGCNAPESNCACLARFQHEKIDSLANSTKALVEKL